MRNLWVMAGLVPPIRTEEEAVALAEQEAFLDEYEEEIRADSLPPEQNEIQPAVSGPSVVNNDPVQNLAAMISPPAPVPLPQPTFFSTPTTPVNYISVPNYTPVPLRPVFIDITPSRNVPKTNVMRQLF